MIEGGGEIDLAGAPLIRFSFAPEFHELQLSSDTKEATPQQTVALEGIEFLSRGGKPEQIGKISRMELKFSQHEAGKMNFDELIIRAPSFQITPDALKTVGPPILEAANRTSRTKIPPAFPIFASANCWSKTARFSSRISAKRFPKAR